MASCTNHAIPAACGLLRVLVFVLCAGAVARAETTLAVRIGFQGHVVPERYAPLHVDVAGYVGPGEAHISVSQTIGSPWSDLALVRQNLGVAVTADGSYRASIPIYDPRHPLQITLLAADGTPLAETTVDLRSTSHLDPFPVCVGLPRDPIAPGCVRVAADDVPLRWDGLDAVSILWILSPLSRETWQAVGEWVVAGGCAVLIAGQDYFRFDTPPLRTLLPLQQPTIARSQAGVPYLAGELKAGSFVRLSRDNMPLLIERQVGAGHFAVLSLDASSLTEDELQTLPAAIPSGSRPLPGPLTEALLAALPIDGPTHLAALWVLASSAAALAGATLVARARSARGGVTLACVLFLAVAVFSGLIANRTPLVDAVILIRTYISAAPSFGIYTDSLSFYSPGGSARWHAVGREAIPALAPTMPQHNPLGSASFLSTSVSSSAGIARAIEHTARSGQALPLHGAPWLRSFYAFESASPSLRLTYDPARETAVIENPAQSALSDAWLLADGRGARIIPPSIGTATYRLEGRSTLRALVREARPDAALILEHLSEDWPLHEGVWLVAISSAALSEAAQPGRKVRHLEIHIVQGDLS